MPKGWSRITGRKQSKAPDQGGGAIKTASAPVLTANTATCAQPTSYSFSGLMPQGQPILPLRRIATSPIDIQKSAVFEFMSNGLKDNWQLSTRISKDGQILFFRREQWIYPSQILQSYNVPTNSILKWDTHNNRYILDINLLLNVQELHINFSPRLQGGETVGDYHLTLVTESIRIHIGLSRTGNTADTPTHAAMRAISQSSKGSDQPGVIIQTPLKNLNTTKDLIKYLLDCAAASMPYAQTHEPPQTILFKYIRDALLRHNGLLSMATAAEQEAIPAAKKR